MIRHENVQIGPDPVVLGGGAEIDIAMSLAFTAPGDMRVGGPTVSAVAGRLVKEGEFFAMDLAGGERLYAAAATELTVEVLKQGVKP